MSIQKIMGKLVTGIVIGIVVSLILSVGAITLNQLSQTPIAEESPETQETIQEGKEGLNILNFFLSLPWDILSIVGAFFYVILKINNPKRRKTRI